MYCFIWGPLFGFSPIINGFEQKEFDKATIYYRGDFDISKFSKIDNIIEEIEYFHELKFKKKVKIVIFSTD